MVDAPAGVGSVGVLAPVDLVRVLGSSRLRRRRFDSIPLRGPGAAYTDTQPRQPGDSSAPVELADLISSIAEIGVLQPILVEEIESGEGPPAMRVVAGERRLRACRWGAAHLPDNDHFNGIPAIICPGPLSESERRTWQLIENLAREPLRPGEQAAALLLHRCAILTGKLLKAGTVVPVDVYELEDPVARFTALEKLRGGDPSCAAPWAEVLTRLGLQLSPRKARELVRAFAALPRELSEDMDEAKITLHTRIRFAQLRQGRAAAADEIWTAVKSRRRVDLLTAAVNASLDAPGLAAGEAIEAAEELHETANRSRAEKLTRRALDASWPTDRQPDRSARSNVAEAVNGRHAAAGGGAGEERATAAGVSQMVSAEAVRAAVRALRGVLTELRDGRRLGRYDAGSLRLVVGEMYRLLGTGQAAR